MNPRLLPLSLALATTLMTGCADWPVHQAARVATASTSQWLCGSTFVSGLDPDTSFESLVRPMAGMNLVSWGLGYRVDRQRREVSTTLLGGFTSRAVFRDRLGCVVIPDDGVLLPESPPPQLPSMDAQLPEIAGPEPVVPASPALAAAVALAFGEPGEANPHQTHAVVVLHQGRVVAERYAAGIGPDTPLLGFSMNKSIINALLGGLVLQGRLDMAQPAPVPTWRAPDDPRRAITTDLLLRQASGLALPHAESGFDLSSQIMFTVRDKSAAAAAAPLVAPPGTRWNYTDPHFALLGKIVHDAAGGNAGAVLRFAHQALFGPLGMRTATMEFDATGTPVGAANTYASARDWARFGQLYLADGLAGARRLLPSGWVRYSTTPTLDTGYGAGFWLNSGPGRIPGTPVPWGLPQAPRDTFFARGNLGQFVVIIPSRQLVIVRLGASHLRGPETNIAVAMDRWVAAILAALAPPHLPA